MTMYGLFYMTYDYHEWENLVCVSDSIDKLIRYAKGKGCPITVLPDNKDEHDHYASKETAHYVISEVEAI